MIERDDKLHSNILKFAYDFWALDYTSWWYSSSLQFICEVHSHEIVRHTTSLLFNFFEFLIFANPWNRNLILEKFDACFSAQKVLESKLACDRK